MAAFNFTGRSNGAMDCKNCTSYPPSHPLLASSRTSNSSYSSQNSNEFSPVQNNNYNKNTFNAHYPHNSYWIDSNSCWGPPNIISSCQMNSSSNQRGELLPADCQHQQQHLSPFQQQHHCPGTTMVNSNNSGNINRANGIMAAENFHQHYHHFQYLSSTPAAIHHYHYGNQQQQEQQKHIETTLKRPEPICGNRQLIQPNNINVNSTHLSLANDGAIADVNNDQRGQGENTIVTTAAAIGRAQPRRELIVLTQPERQHRARYESEGSRGAIKDCSGKSHCIIKLVGHNLKTTVQMFAVQKNRSGHFFPHNKYKLIPVAGKSSSTTECKLVKLEDGSERLEIQLWPDNQMVGVLNCIGILKICSHGMKNEMVQNGKKGRKRELAEEQIGKSSFAEEALEHRKESFDQSQKNMVYIMAQALLPPVDVEEGEQILSPEGGNANCRSSNKSRWELVQTVTEPILCVQVNGAPEIMKMSLEGANPSGGQELFIIGRNFEPKNTKVLFREYRDDGSLEWCSEARIIQPFLHQCYIVCSIPRYNSQRKKGTVSLTIFCGTKQSHPKNFYYYSTEGEEDDDWGPPECTDKHGVINVNAISRRA